MLTVVPLTLHLQAPSQWGHVAKCKELSKVSILNSEIPILKPSVGANKSWQPVLQPVSRKLENFSPVKAANAREQAQKAGSWDIPQKAPILLPLWGSHSHTCGPIKSTKGSIK